MRATRDLMRRRNHLMRKRSELIAHIQNTASQYNLPPFEHRIAKKHQRVGLLEHFPDVQVRNSVALDVAMIDHYDELLPKLERHIRACAKGHDSKAFMLLRSIHGADLIIPLIILYEVHDIARFPRVQEFLSYCRLVKPTRESAGKIYGHSGGKIGNAHLKWAFGSWPPRSCAPIPEPSSCTSGSSKSTARAKRSRCWPPSSPAPPTTCSAEERSSTRTSSTRIESEAAV